MDWVVIDVSLSYDDMLKAYQGTVRTVQGIDVKGRKIRFPADILREFVTHDGVYGRFQIKISENNHFEGIKRLN
jgi:hypothetical protein